jgi:tripartite-type tricarboxylate transporter receptor subunit TctC
MRWWCGRGVVVALLVSIGGLAAAAQDYPTKPIRFVVPWPPGGGADIVSRIVGQTVGQLFGQQLVIDNRPGAGGNIGAEAASHAAPDGYTILFGYVAPCRSSPRTWRRSP